MTTISMNRVNLLPRLARHNLAFQAASPARAVRGAAAPSRRVAPAITSDRHTRKWLGLADATAMVPAVLASGLVLWFGGYFVPAVLNFAQSFPHISG